MKLKTLVPILIVSWLLTLVTLSGIFVSIWDYPKGENVKIRGQVFPGGRYAEDVEVEGNYAYVAMHNENPRESDSLGIFNISEKNNPIEVGSCSIKGPPWAIALSGDYAYISYSIELDNYTHENHLAIVDVDQKSAPKKISDCTLSFDWFDYNAKYRYRNSRYSRVEGVAVVGDHVYVADGGFHIVNVSDKENPVEVHHNYPYGAYDVAVVGDYAYLADGTLTILDISNRSNPLEISNTTGYYASAAVMVEGNYAYIAAGEDGLVIIDISNKTDPRKVGHCSSSDVVEDVAVSGNHAYVAGRYEGMSVIDVSNKNAPRKIGYFDYDSVASYESIYGEAGGIACDDDYIYRADMSRGLLILEYENGYDRYDGSILSCLKRETFLLFASILWGLVALPVAYPSSTKREEMAKRGMNQK